MAFYFSVCLYFLRGQAATTETARTGAVQRGHVCSRFFRSDRFTSLFFRFVCLPSTMNAIPGFFWARQGVRHAVFASWDIRLIVEAELSSLSAVEVECRSDDACAFLRNLLKSRGSREAGLSLVLGEQRPEQPGVASACSRGASAFSFYFGWYHPAVRKLNPIRYDETSV